MHPNDVEGVSDVTINSDSTSKLLMKAKRSITYNTVDSDNEYMLLLDLPGVKVSDVTVNVEKPNTLTVHAIRKLKNEEQITLEQKFLVDKKIADISTAKSTLENGVLTVQMAKVKPTEPMTVDVKTTDIDWKEEGERFMWTHDLPGVKSSDVKVTYHDDHVSILATRKRGDNIFKIFKKVSLPEDKFNVKELQAFLVDGVLTVTAPVLVDKVKSETIENGEKKVTTIPVLTNTATTNDTDGVVVNPFDDSVLVNH
jgi:HSP20 family molecular chaperone IbpA